jgi:hypothetical protein
MIHQYLAATFCTTALVFFAVQALSVEVTRFDRTFGILYGLGMIGWLVLGVYVESVSLIFISLVQSMSSLVILAARRT